MSLIQKRNNDGRVSVLNKTQEKIKSKLPVQKLPKRRLYRKEKRPKRASSSETKTRTNTLTTTSFFHIQATWWLYKTMPLKNMKIMKRRHRRGLPFNVHKHLYVNCLGGLLKSGGSDSECEDIRLEGNVSKDVVALEEYCRNSEKELNKYQLRCTCDNLASGIDDGGAMRDAHIILALDLLEPLEKWNEKKSLEQKRAMDENPGLESNFGDWEEVKKDGDKLKEIFLEARKELLEFEALNAEYFCGMTVGKTFEEKMYWRNLKNTKL